PAGAPNRTLCEYHNLAVIAYRQLANNLPEPENGWLTMPDAPGLGFDINQEAVREFRCRSRAVYLKLKDPLRPRLSDFRALLPLHRSSRPRGEHVVVHGLGHAETRILG